MSMGVGCIIILRGTRGISSLPPRLTPHKATNIARNAREIVNWRAAPHIHIYAVQRGLQRFESTAHFIPLEPRAVMRIGGTDWGNLGKLCLTPQK